MGKIKKYIEFNLVQQKPKTGVYAVRNIKSQSIIGWVKWYPYWRQYCFFPEPETVYSVGCLQDIVEFKKSLSPTRKERNER